MADMCRNGLHEMTPENTLTRDAAGRRCRLCRNAYMREWRSRRPLPTHCSNGHEWRPESTRLTRDGRRTCLDCIADRRATRLEAAGVGSDDELKNLRARQRYARDAAYRERAKANSARRYARIMSDPELHEKEKERNRTRSAADHRHPVKGELRRQRHREYVVRMSTDPEWVARQRQLRSDNDLIRYATDPEYRERRLRQSRESAHRIRALKRATVRPGTSVTIPADLGDAVKRLGGGDRG